MKQRLQHKLLLLTLNNFQNSPWECLIFTANDGRKAAQTPISVTFHRSPVKMSSVCKLLPMQQMLQFGNKQSHGMRWRKYKRCLTIPNPNAGKCFKLCLVSGLQHYQYDYGILTQTWMILLNCILQVITQNWLVILCIHSLILWVHATYKNNVNITFQNYQQFGEAHYVKPYVLWWLQAHSSLPMLHQLSPLHAENFPDW
jgi:hypothetical protein